MKKETIIKSFMWKNIFQSEKSMKNFMWIKIFELKQKLWRRKFFLNLNKLKKIYVLNFTVGESIKNFIWIKIFEMKKKTSIKSFMWKNLFQLKKKYKKFRVSKNFELEQKL